MRALTINRFQGNGILALGANGVVEGCYIGVSLSGATAFANQFNGVLISGTATNVRIGGASVAARNIISGNLLNGVAILGALTSAHKIQGNFIGTDVAGSADLGNSGFGGVQIRLGSINNTVGGTTAAARNIISGNDRMGVFIHESGTTGNVVQGNFIGLASNGTTAIGNTSHGVFIASVAANNSIGGTAVGAGNRIAHNGGDGVLIGSDPAFAFTTAAGSGNSVQGNSIFSNVGQGIDLGANNGPTANDNSDPDPGPNDLLNTPVITNAYLAGTRFLLMGSINTVTNKNLRIEFFASPTGGQGQTFLGSLNLSMGGINSRTFAKAFTVPTSVLVGHKITATITDQLGNTSEFSIPTTIE